MIDWQSLYPMIKAGLLEPQQPVKKKPVLLEMWLIPIPHRF